MQMQIDPFGIESITSALKKRKIMNEQIKEINESINKMKRWQREIERSNKKEPNLLEIKLKDTDSVPEVYYKGERLDESPKALVDISYHYRTTGEWPDDSANDINIEYYSTSNDKYLDKKTIGHKRDM